MITVISGTTAGGTAAARLKNFREHRGSSSPDSPDGIELARLGCSAVELYAGELTVFPVVDWRDASKTLGVAPLAIVPAVAIAGLTASGTWSPSQTVKALIDTGATTSAIHPSLAADLGDLMRVGREKGGDTNAPDGQAEAPLYELRVTITGPDGSEVEWHPVYAIERPYEQPEEMGKFLIGCDILGTCRFTYDGTANPVITLPDGSEVPTGRFILEKPDLS